MPRNRRELDSLIQEMINKSTSRSDNPLDQQRALQTPVKPSRSDSVPTTEQNLHVTSPPSGCTANKHLYTAEEFLSNFLKGYLFSQQVCSAVLQEKDATILKLDQEKCQLLLQLEELKKLTNRNGSSNQSESLDQSDEESEFFERQQEYQRQDMVAQRYEELAELAASQNDDLPEPLSEQDQDSIENDTIDDAIDDTIEYSPPTPAGSDMSGLSFVSRTSRVVPPQVCQVPPYASPPNMLESRVSPPGSPPEETDSADVSPHFLEDIDRFEPSSEDDELHVMINLD